VYEVWHVAKLMLATPSISARSHRQCQQYQDVLRSSQASSEKATMRLSVSIRISAGEHAGIRWPASERFECKGKLKVQVQSLPSVSASPLGVTE